MKKLYVFLATFFVLAFAHPVAAHSFGKLYNLPIPFQLYLFGVTGALIVSFLIIAYFAKASVNNHSYPSKTVDATFRKFFFITAVRILIQWLFLILFLVSMVAGFIGSNNSYQNINVTFFWIVFVLILAYAVGIIGDFYQSINPFLTILKLLNKTGFSLGSKPIFSLEKWQYYIGWIIYAGFIIFELFGQTTPYKLSAALIIYLLITLIGVVLFGKDSWFQKGDFFSIFFRLFGQIGILETVNNKLYLRPPFAGLLNLKVQSFSLLLFIMLMLSSTLTDGLKETLFLYRIYILNIRPFFSISLVQFQITIFLISPFIFLLIYLFCVFLAKLVTSTKQKVLALAYQLAPSVVPIAFVYHVSHYYTLILTEGKNFFGLLSDPFGFGWNLFGTAGLWYKPLILDATTTWHFQVGIILFGHIVAVYLAHILALTMFKTSAKAFLSQIPLLFLMVVFTVTGLWILSLPIK